MRTIPSTGLVIGAVKVDTTAMAIPVLAIIKTVVSDSMLLVIHVNHVSQLQLIAIIPLPDHVVGHVIRITTLLVVNVSLIRKIVVLDNISLAMSVIIVVPNQVIRFILKMVLVIGRANMGTHVMEILVL